MSLDGQGDLVLHTASGDVLQHAPVVYQEVGGSREAVAGHFVLLGPERGRVSGRHLRFGVATGDRPGLELQHLPRRQQ